MPTDELRLDARMAYYRVPAVSIAVIEGGRLAWARAWGAVEPEGAAVTTHTLFQAGSISKPVVAAAALRLVEQGTLSLDEDVNSSLRSWRIPANDFTRRAPVTVRRLLSHTAGLTVFGFAGYAVDTPLPTIGQILEGAPPANTEAVRVVSEPGSGWRYSGGGYTVLQALLTDVTARPFPDLLEDLVLRPAGMTHSTFRQPLPRSEAAHAATGTRPNGQAITGRWHVYPEVAAAGLWTTPSDLGAFILDLQARHAVLSFQMATTMMTPVVNGCGLGLAVEGEGSARRFRHNGANEGFRAAMVGYVEGGRGAVVMVNSDNGLELAEELLRAIAREYGWPGYPLGGHVRDELLVPREKLAELAGRYRAGDQPEVIVELRGDHLVMRESVSGATFMTLYPSSPTHFFLLSGPPEIEFLLDGRRARAMHLIGPAGKLLLELARTGE